MAGPLFYLHLVAKHRTADSSGSFHPPPICRTFLCLNPRSGSWLIEFAPPFRLCGLQVPALLHDRTRACFTWPFLPSVKRYLPARPAVGTTTGATHTHVWGHKGGAKPCGAWNLADVGVPLQVKECKITGTGRGTRRNHRKFRIWKSWQVSRPHKTQTVEYNSWIHCLTHPYGTF